MKPLSDERGDRTRINAALIRLRAIYSDLREAHAGVAVLHLEATMAALESRLRQAASATPR